MNITIHKVAKVAGGFEYFYSIFDDDNNVLLGNQFQFIGKTEPTSTETETWIADRLDRFSVEQQEQIESETNKQETIEASTVDIDLITLKANVKTLAMGMIKTNPDVTVDEIKVEVNTQLGSTAASMTEGFVAMYINEAFTRELIEEETYEALKTFIGSLTIEQIQEIK